MQKAEKYFKHCIKLNPVSVPAHFGLGKILHQYGINHFSDALLHYKYVVDNDPQHFKAYCQIGLIYLETQELERAADYLKKCLKINSKYVVGMIAMGNLLFESGHANTAAKYF